MAVTTVENFKRLGDTYNIGSLMDKDKCKCFRCGEISKSILTPMTITPDRKKIYCCSKCVQDWNNCEEKTKFFHDRSQDSFLWLKYFLIFVKRTKRSKEYVIYT